MSPRIQLSTFEGLYHLHLQGQFLLLGIRVDETARRLLQTSERCDESISRTVQCRSSYSYEIEATAFTWRRKRARVHTPRSSRELITRPALM